MGKKIGLGSNHDPTMSWLCDFSKLLSPSETPLLHLQPSRAVRNKWHNGPSVWVRHPFKVSAPTLIPPSCQRPVRALDLWKQPHFSPNFQSSPLAFCKHIHRNDKAASHRPLFSSPKHANCSSEWGFQEPASSSIASHHQIRQQQTQFQTSWMGRIGPSSLRANSNVGAGLQMFSIPIVSLFNFKLSAHLLIRANFLSASSLYTWHNWVGWETSPG